MYVEVISPLNIESRTHYRIFDCDYLQSWANPRLGISVKLSMNMCDNSNFHLPLYRVANDRILTVVRTMFGFSICTPPLWYLSNGADACFNLRRR